MDSEQNVSSEHQGVDESEWRQLQAMYKLLKTEDGLMKRLTLGV